MLSNEEINSAVWEAQIKVLFPVIEKFKKGFIDKYWSHIKSCLPFKDPKEEKFV